MRNNQRRNGRRITSWAALIAVPGILSVAGMGLVASQAAAQTVSEATASLVQGGVQYFGDAGNDVLITTDELREQHAEITIDHIVPSVGDEGCDYSDA